MKSKLIPGLAMLTVFFFIVMVRPVTAQTQPSTPTPMPAKLDPTPDTVATITGLERKVFQLETTQSQQIEALKESNDFYKLLLAGLSAIVFAGGVFQVLLTRAQLHRESEQDLRQAEREKEQDQIQSKSARQVSDIMTVVRNTLQERLDAEIQWRNQAETSRRELDRLSSDFRSLEVFF